MIQVHHHPGTVTLNSQKQSKGKSIFPFPIVTDSNLRQVAENGMSREIPIDIVPVEIPNQRLDPGQSLPTSLLVRGPEQPGSHTISLYFYYEAPSTPGSKQVQYRMIRAEFSLKSTGLVTVTATRNRPLLRDNSVCQTILVSLLFHVLFATRIFVSFSFLPCRYQLLIILLWAQALELLCRKSRS